MSIFGLIFVVVFGALPKPGFGLIDQSTCPIGWQVANDICIKIVIPADTLENAKEYCSLEGGQLLDTSTSSTSRDLILDDVSDLLKNLYDLGLDEPTFFISGQGQALNRTKPGKYDVISTHPSSAFPFICSLNKMERRSLLIQQNLLPRGAPRLISSAQPEIYYHSRADADFIALPCVVEGVPKPAIFWYQNDQEVVSPTTSTTNSTFLLSGGNLLVPASPSLAYSTFHCTARNVLGEVRSPPILLRPSFIDPFRQHRLDVFSMMNGGAKLDCDAPPHQPKSLTYNWKVGDGNGLVAQNERRFISLDGTLFFSYVEKEDEQSYACSLSVYATKSGHYGPSFRLITSSSNSNSTSSFAPRLDSSQPQLFPDTPKIGESIYLECFAYGNPLPTYKWSRVDGRPLPPTAQISNFGRVLKIEKAAGSAAGRYKCTASNVHGISAGEILVNLRAPPTILQPLYDRQVAQGGHVAFECLMRSADAEASAIEWFKDARPIVPLLLPADKRRRITMSGNVLRIENAEPSDTGMYQCIINGAAQSSAHLSVHDAAPRFPPNAMPRKIFAAIESRLEIPCVFEALPRTRGKWRTLRGTRLPAAGRLHQMEGVMVIEKVLREDEGVFFCLAHNRAGKAHAQVEIVVIDKPSIEANATRSSSSSSSPTTTNLSCELELSCSTTDCPEPLFELLINNRPPATKPEQVFFRTHKNRHKINVEVAHGVGRFACSSLFGGTSEVVTRPVLPSPIGVEVSEVASGRKMILKWRLPQQHRDTRDHSTKVNGYLIELRTKKDRKWRAAERRQLTDIDNNSSQLSNLLPNTDYQFRVRSIDTAQIGEPSHPTAWIKTAPGPPNDIISTLKWRPLDSQTLLVEWSKIEEDDGDNLRYHVTWQEGNQTQPKTLDSDQSQAILKLGQVDEEEECRMISISVKPVNDQGEGSVSTETIAFLNSRGEMRRVEMYNVVPINASHVNISWIWADRKKRECHTMHSVQITCLKTVPDVQEGGGVEAIVGDAKMSWMLGGLEADTAYECDLRAVDNHGNLGPASRRFRIHTKQHPPGQAPEIKSLKMKFVDDEYKPVIEWTRVDLHKNPNLTDFGCGYLVLVDISENGNDPIRLEMPVKNLTDKSNPSARLSGLRLMHKYTIRVAAYNPGGVGPLSEPESFRPGSPSSLDYTSSAPPGFSQTFIILAFFIFGYIF